MPAHESAHESAHELDAPPWRRVESTLMATSRALRRAYDTRLASTGLNQSEASVLALVGEEGELTQAEVARRIGMRRAAAGAVIERLEQRDLIERTPDVRDRRVWLVQLAPAAQPVVDQIRGIDQQLRAELRRGITKAERRQLAATLEQLRANLAGVTDDPA